MVQGSKLTTLLQFNGMIQHARDGKDIFVDELSNFLVQEFELHALAIFKLDGGKLVLLGKSGSVKKHIKTVLLFNLRTVLILILLKSLQLAIIRIVYCLLVMFRLMRFLFHSG